MRVAHTGRDAVGSIFSFAPHLVLLDVNLPGLSGFEVCRHVRARGFRNPIQMLTARGDQADKLVGLEIGADDYITEPFDSREVLARARARLREVDRLQIIRSAAAPPHRSRRLLAVMFTDMKDFSRRMNEDEELGLALLNKHNAILTKSITQCHRCCAVRWQNSATASPLQPEQACEGTHPMPHRGPPWGCAGGGRKAARRYRQHFGPSSAACLARANRNFQERTAGSQGENARSSKAHRFQEGQKHPSTHCRVQHRGIDDNSRGAP